MDLQRLQIFRDVIRTGSFAGAARIRRANPSIVSRAISALEAELGVRLLQRSTRRLALTEAGQTYLARIEPLLEELSAAHEAAAGLVERPRGRLRVTASNAFGLSVLAPMLPRFCSQYPDVEIEMVLTDEVLDLVALGIDVAIRLGPRPTGDLVTSRWKPMQNRAVAAPSYLARAKPILTPEDVSDHPCLRFPFGDFATQWRFREAEGREVLVPVSGKIASSNALVLRETALAGLGVALLADWLIDEDLAAGRLKHVLPSWRATANGFESGVWFVYPSRSFLPQKARVFIDSLRAGDRA